ncbi:MAG: PIN domain-containing protein [Hormoscilla sp. SP5CHS1]|nr:PIN domain-containing protein [Hormoscilla sp. SP12CHS1]MBC6453339.1 PIN domain-containing protein [Hormoscilla sp. SP5CHS1]
MKRTYIDSGVLIEAVRGTNAVALKARRIITDTNREFASSIFVKLEVIPKATYYKNAAEVAFYERFFNSVVHWAHPDDRLMQAAYQHACDFNMAAIDALHVAAAISVGAEELITTEKLNKPIHRATGITVVSIQPA